VKTTHRVLKDDRVVVVCMGDNRKECYYQPLSFQVFDLYRTGGFELEEIVVKRQRHCQGSMKGSYLSVQHDFLMIQHEFIATFRKLGNDKTFGNSYQFTPFSNLKEETNRFSISIRHSTVEHRQHFAGSVWVLQDNCLLDHIISRFGNPSGPSYLARLDLDFVTNVFKQTKSLNFCIDNAGKQGEDPLDIFEFHKNRESDQSIPFHSKNEFCGPVLLLIPHVEVPGCSSAETNWIDAYRYSIIETIKNALNNSKLGIDMRIPEKSSAQKPIIIVGVKDFRTMVPYKPQIKADLVSKMERFYADIGVDPNEDKSSDTGYQDERPCYVPLSFQVLDDITRRFSENLRTKEFLICTPSGYQCSSSTPAMEIKIQLENERKRWIRETRDRKAGVISDQMNPIVHACYFIFEAL
jgi:hypothetical protein